MSRHRTFGASRLALLVGAAFLLAGCPEADQTGPPEVPGGATETAPLDTTAEPEEAIPATAQPDFDYSPPGEVHAWPNVSLMTGDTDTSVHAPNMMFPITPGPAFANSQYYGYGGFAEPPTGDGKGERDPRNFDYAWRDTFCELREANKLKNGRCPSGVGHQGNDIRPPTCDNGRWTAVAPEDVQVVYIGSYSVLLYAPASDLTYVYLHTFPPAPGLTVGQSLNKGDPVGGVSDLFGTSDTTVHLHFEIWDGFITSPGSPTRASGAAALSPYTSLIEAYLDLLAAHPDQKDPVPQPSNAAACRRT